MKRMKYFSIIRSIVPGLFLALLISYVNTSERSSFSPRNKTKRAYDFITNNITNTDKSKEFRSEIINHQNLKEHDRKTSSTKYNQMRMFAFLILNYSYNLSVISNYTKIPEITHGSSSKFPLGRMPMIKYESANTLTVRNSRSLLYENGYEINGYNKTARMTDRRISHYKKKIDANVIDASSILNQGFISYDPINSFSKSVDILHPGNYTEHNTVTLEESLLSRDALSSSCGLVPNTAPSGAVVGCPSASNKNCDCWDTYDEAGKQEIECCCSGHEITIIPKDLCTGVNRM